MQIGKRLREVRELSGLSQGDIERSTGLLRCYVSRVENGHTVPSLDTLEKWAYALKVPLYRIFCAGDEVLRPPRIPEADGLKLWGSSEEQVPELRRLLLHLRKMDKRRRKVLLLCASRIVGRS
jgi:transcriptional regulator with XRE-family HTH domain